MTDVEDEGIHWIWWRGDKTRWPSVTVDMQDLMLNKQLLKHKEIVKWITENIEGCYRHCEWNYDENSTVVKFRKERDMMTFMLRWC